MPEAPTRMNNAVTIMRDTTTDVSDHEHEIGSHDHTFFSSDPTHIHTHGVALAPYMSDKDADSSDDDMEVDGGVSISLILDHAQALNEEMDLIDMDIMGEENLAGTHMEGSDDEYTSQLPAHHNQPNAPGTPPGDDVDVWSIDEGSIDGHNVPPGQTGWGTHGINDNSISPSTQVHIPLDPLGAMEMVVDVANSLTWDLEDQQAAGGLQANISVVEDQYNLNLFDFLWSWGDYVGDEPSRGSRRMPHLPAIARERTARPSIVQRNDLQGEECDLQGLNWDAFGVMRAEARRMRKKTYTNYTNLRQSPFARNLYATQPPNSENYFMFRRMDLSHRPNLSHFQLRNLLACTSRHQIFYPGRSMIYQASPFSGTKDTIIDLTDPIVQPAHSLAGGIQISTLAAAYGVLLAGGFCGEYALLNLNGPAGTRHHEGLFTEHPNSITNSISIDLSRHSGLPIATISSNDDSLRVMDLTTQKFIYEVKFPYAMNCTATSPDHRLRVLVGDTKDVLICSTNDGEVLQRLPGHKDFGFACAWADDGIHVATGNQDQTIKIWDARNWKAPIHNLGTELAGIRSLRFSPLGSGKRVLLAAEPADIVNVIDAETYASKQVLDFFGEIGGISFTPDGQEFYVANCDSSRGGIIEYERTGFGESYGQAGIDDDSDHVSDEENGWDWKPTLSDISKDPRSMRTTAFRRRQPAHMAPIGLF